MSEKNEEAEKREKEFERRVRSKLTRYEWRKLRERLEMGDHLSRFQRDFRKHLSSLITGAFAFVAALFWRDAIKTFFAQYQNYIQSLVPLKGELAVQFFTAFVVSVVAILVIVVISSLMRTD